MKETVCENTPKLPQSLVPFLEPTSLFSVLLKARLVFWITLLSSLFSCTDLLFLFACSAVVVVCFSDSSSDCIAARLDSLLEFARDTFLTGVLGAPFNEHEELQREIDEVVEMEENDDELGFLACFE